MMKKLILLPLILMMCSPLFVHGQIEDAVFGKERPAWLDKFYVGGGLGGLSFSDDQTIINVSVMVGYRFTEKLNSGVNVNYIYQDNKLVGFTSKGLGWNFFTQYTIYDPFFLMARYDIFTITYQLDGRSFKRTLDAVLFGGGVNQRLGNNGFLSLYALYNIKHSVDHPEDNIYASPWVIGANIGIGF